MIPGRVTPLAEGPKGQLTMTRKATQAHPHLMEANTCRRQCKYSAARRAAGTHFGQPDLCKALCKVQWLSCLLGSCPADTQMLRIAALGQAVSPIAGEPFTTCVPGERL